MEGSVWCKFMTVMHYLQYALTVSLLRCTSAEGAYRAPVGLTQTHEGAKS